MTDTLTNKILESFRERFGSNLWEEIGFGGWVARHREIEHFLTQAISQVREEILEEVREKCEKYKKEQLSDPWAFGMNREMTSGYVRAMEDILELLASLAKKEGEE